MKKSLGGKKRKEKNGFHTFMSLFQKKLNERN
jgi:hypothetical protein